MDRQVQGTAASAALPGPAAVTEIDEKPFDFRSNISFGSTFPIGHPDPPNGHAKSITG